MNTADRESIQNIPSSMPSPPSTGTQSAMHITIRTKAQAGMTAETSLLLLIATQSTQEASIAMSRSIRTAFIPSASSGRKCRRN